MYFAFYALSSVSFRLMITQRYEVDEDATKCCNGNVYNKMSLEQWAAYDSVSWLNIKEENF